MKIEKIILTGEIPVNCFIIEHNNKCYIVDPGYKNNIIEKYITANNIEVLGILLTHGHIDHIGAIDSYKVPVYIHEKEIEVIKDSFKNGAAFFGQTRSYNFDTISFSPIKEGIKIPLDDKSIEVFHTPGHTPGGVCYKIDDDIITGDTLFQCGVGRWDFPTGDLADLQKSVITLIETQPDHCRIHPGHGNSSIIASEKKCNDYYLEWRS